MEKLYTVSRNKTRTRSDRTIAVKKKRSKRKRGKGKLYHLNAEFQRIVRRVGIVRRD